MKEVKLEMIILFSLFLNNAFANDFSDVDKIEADRQEFNIENINGMENGKILELQTVLKFNGNLFINNDFNSVKQPKNENEENESANDANKAVESFNLFAFSLENRFNFNLYDGIRFEVPLSFRYDSYYSENALNRLGDYGLHLSRIALVELGLWIDWDAVSFFKLGLRGGKDSHTGNMLLVKNKLYVSKFGDTFQQHGFDLVDYNFLIFGKFLVGNSWLQFQPEMQFCFEGGYPVVASGKILDLIFAIKINTPLKFKVNFLDSLTLRAKIDIGVDKAFSGETSFIEKKYGADSGYGLYSKNSVELEYILLKMLIIRLPLSINWSGRFFGEKFEPSCLKAKLDPNMELNLKLFENVYLVADLAFEYEFMKAKFDTETEFSFLVSPTLKYGLGFRYESIY